MKSQYNQYMQQHHNIYRTFYDHHKLAPKISRKKDKLLSIPRQLNNDILTKSTNIHIQTQQNIKNNKISNSKSILSSKSKQKLQQNIKYGRQLFKKQIKNNQNLGPGVYNPSLLKSQSYGYIPKPTQQFFNPLIQLNKLKQNFLGPGKYKHQQSQNYLSRHKNTKGIRFSSQKLIRCIVNQNNKDKINLVLNEEAENKRESWKVKLGPGCYDNQQQNSNNIFVKYNNNNNNMNNNTIYHNNINSKFQKPKSYSISMTQRSSLISKQTIPGPGYYQWTKYLQKVKQKTKPIIQFKFVHANQ